MASIRIPELHEHASANQLFLDEQIHPQTRYWDALGQRALSGFRPSDLIVEGKHGARGPQGERLQTRLDMNLIPLNLSDLADERETRRANVGLHIRVRFLVRPLADYPQ